MSEAIVDNPYLRSFLCKEKEIENLVTKTVCDQEETLVCVLKQKIRLKIVQCYYFDRH